MRKNEIFGSDRLFAVMFGGRGCEHEISCKTAGNVINTARRIGYSILPVAIDKQVIFIFISATVSGSGTAIAFPMQKCFCLPFL